MSLLERVRMPSLSGTTEWLNSEPLGRFLARDAHLVLARGDRERLPFRVGLDGAPPRQSHGIDVDEDGNGLLGDGRLYELMHENEAVRERTLEISFLERGAEAYVFAFE